MPGTKRPLGDTELGDLLARFGKGDPQASSRLLSCLYWELHEVARVAMIGERPDHTLEPTALVNEAYLRLARLHRMEWVNKAQFLAVAAETMRNILIDHARAKRAKKRGGSWIRVTLSEEVHSPGVPDVDILELDEALGKLAALSTRQARVIDLRYFVGLTVEETARVLGVSSGTVRSDSAVAKAWLLRELSTA